MFKGLSLTKPKDAEFVINRELHFSHVDIYIKLKDFFKQNFSVKSSRVGVIEEVIFYLLYRQECFFVSFQFLIVGGRLLNNLIS